MLRIIAVTKPSLDSAQAGKTPRVCVREAFPHSSIVHAEKVNSLLKMAFHQWLEYPFPKR